MQNTLQVYLPLENRLKFTYLQEEWMNDSAELQY